MPKTVFRQARAIVVALIASASLVASPRAEAAQDAGAFIAELGKQAIQVLGPSVPPAQRAAQFRQLFQNDFDLPNIARFVLGPQGRSMPPGEQQEFLNVFREFLVQSYTARLGEYAGEPFRVTGSRPQEDATIVTSQVVRKGGAPVEIDWHVVNRNGRFLITDVAVDGVSMKVTQRNEFAGIIQRNGGRPEALVAALRQQLGLGRGQAQGQIQGPPALSGSSTPPMRAPEPLAPAR
jgi:phospholipid transport system substrate-binding protein